MLSTDDVNPCVGAYEDWIKDEESRELPRTWTGQTIKVEDIPLYANCVGLLIVDYRGYMNERRRTDPQRHYGSHWFQIDGDAEGRKAPVNHYLVLRPVHTLSASLPIGCI